MKGVITLQEVLSVIDTDGMVFSITVTKADRKRGTGGQISHYAAAQKADFTKLPDNILKRNGIPESQKKDPGHWDKKTRNIYIPKTQRIIKIHIKLINELNGKTVVL